MTKCNEADATKHMGCGDEGGRCKDFSFPLIHLSAYILRSAGAMSGVVEIMAAETLGRMSVGCQ